MEKKHMTIASKCASVVRKRVGTSDPSMGDV